MPIGHRLPCPVTVADAVVHNALAALVVDASARAWIAAAVDSSRPTCRLAEKIAPFVKPSSIQMPIDRHICIHIHGVLLA